ncbi:hypothetical protein [Limnohabitans sp.]|uniref:hypothetical protein n=1 Tax=Limnohabitans sp. TaxID=1907725 RepID=UPI0037C0814F
MLDTRGHTPHVRTQRLLGSDAQVWDHIRAQQAGRQHRGPARDPGSSPSPAKA